MTDRTMTSALLVDVIINIVGDVVITQETKNNIMAAVAGRSGDVRYFCETT